MRLAKKLEDFLERAAELVAGECDNTLDAVFQAATESDLPDWVLESGRQYQCSCEFLLNQESFLLKVRANGVGHVEDSELFEVERLLDQIQQQEEAEE